MTDALFDFAPVRPAMSVPPAVGPDAQPAFELTVRGVPAPQGSKKAFFNPRLGRAQIVEDSKRTKPWRDRVLGAALEARGDRPPLLGPLCLQVVFTMPKPVSAPKRRRTWPDRKPDLSKLIRAVEDSLTDAGVWKDDGQVVKYGPVEKAYPNEHPDALDTPGVVIRIFTIGATS